MNKCFQKSSLAILLLSGITSLLLNIACDSGGSIKATPPAPSGASNGTKQPPLASNGAKGSTADATLLNLAQSEWKNCFKRPANSSVAGNQAVYALFKMKFSDATLSNGKLVYEAEGAAVNFASDSECKSKISPAKASEINGRDLQLDSETKKAKVEFGNAVGTSGVYELDFSSEGEKYYLLAKITGENFTPTIRCDEAHFKEDLCTKIDGDRPDNRAKTWDMYKDQDPPYTRVK